MIKAQHRVPVSTLETFGLRPFRRGLKECLLAIKGDKTLPATLFGPSSLQVFKPSISLPLWLGKVRQDRRVWVYNFYNHRRPGDQAGYSVRVTDVEDFRGKGLTYDGHGGTDFAVPTGTRICTPAPGKVAWIKLQMNRGGLKIAVDHGGGVFSSSNHLARALVKVDQELKRGEVLGLSGMSSVDGLLFFPWLAPHLHFNTLVAGRMTDPFAFKDQVSIWKTGNAPVPFSGQDSNATQADLSSATSAEMPEPSVFDDEKVAQAIASCAKKEMREELSAIPDAYKRGVHTLMAMTYEGARFSEHPCLMLNPSPRRALFDLPFHRDDYVGVCFADEG